MWHDPEVTRIKKHNVEVYRETMDICTAGFYTLPDGRNVSLPAREAVVASSHWYEKPPQVTHIPTAPESVVNVVLGDCMVVTRELKDAGYNPVMLNMASRTCPGGGVMTGARAQEESLFRRTNLCLSLYPYQRAAAELMGLSVAAKQYPINRDTGGIYSGQIMVFRKGVAADYAFEETPYTCGIVSVPALNRPPLEASGTRLIEVAALAAKERMRTILRIGLLHGHDAIVLSAWGCGAFHNPPTHIAELFCEVLSELEFAGKYRQVRFAIIEDHNSKNRNFAAFQKVFDS